MIGSDQAEGLYLHLGVHRSGTSYFQSFLGLNAGRLHDHGVKAVYPGRDGARDGALRLKLPERAAFDAGALERFDNSFNRQNRRHGFEASRNLLLSEENFPGNMQSHHTDTLFPTARERMAYLCRKVGKPVRRVLYVLRRYDEFYISSYRKRLEFAHMAPFAELRPAMVAMTRGWADVVADIHAGTGAPEIVIARHEALPAAPKLLTALMPLLPAQGWIAPTGRVNASRPIAELTAVQNAKRARSGRLPLEQADFSPGFSDAEIRAFTTRYEQDLTRIAAMPFVRMLG
ncbi:hypothetical protein [Actibacterium ureilyticum]|uniref:hypothetical protein n=1 Tax=Actibacterium ureilyticum TaxID=1590614 RepID=UPI001140E880|nr:hypothetical protein [Actibacterium ureilyticum]